MLHGGTGEKKTRKTEKSSFSQKLFFSQFWLKFGRSGGVRGDGTDHTKTLSRTLAGFGLTWHRKAHFSTFDGKLASKELGVLGYLLGVLGYSDLLGLGVPGYSDLLGLGIPDEWLLDIP